MNYDTLLYSLVVILQFKPSDLHSDFNSDFNDPMDIDISFDKKFV